LGYVPNVEWYYQSADCYVFPIVDKEAAITVPLSVLEAMSTNLPIVSTRFGGLTDIFQPCDGLKFVSAGLPSELVDAVKSATRLPNARTRQQVLPYDWRAVTRRLMEQYRTLGAGDSLREVAEVTV
jgi:glycosyltransferase involved in cell wall biosynthesis